MPVKCLLGMSHQIPRSSRQTRTAPGDRPLTELSSSLHKTRQRLLMPLQALALLGLAVVVLATRETRGNVVAGLNGEGNELHNFNNRLHQHIPLHHIPHNLHHYHHNQRNRNSHHHSSRALHPNQDEMRNKHHSHRKLKRQHNFTQDGPPVLGNITCGHGRRLSGNNGCQCLPCWDGLDCNQYVDNYAPRFLIHKATAVVPVNVTGALYRAWASDEDLGLTCPLGPGEAARCPCAAFTYQLFSTAGDHRFSLHPSTGLLVRRKQDPGWKENYDLEQGTTYMYKLMVQSVLVPGYSRERLFDILDLKIYVGPATLQQTPWT